MVVEILSGDLPADLRPPGGKAWSITEMLRRGIPVPPAFTITTEECHRCYEAGRAIHADALERLPVALGQIEEVTGRTFDREERPLLVSVRSGAPIIMPGIMDTVLNLGTTDTVQATLWATGSVVSRELKVPCIVGVGAGTVSGLNCRLVTPDGRTDDLLDGALPAAVSLG